jgi:hypothetical protein
MDIVGIVGDMSGVDDVGDAGDVGGAGITADAADETVLKDEAGTVQAPRPSENRCVTRAGACHAGARARGRAFPRRGGPDI